MIKSMYIEVESHQVNHHGERICGDVFLKRRIKEDNRVIAVLSDGMGHGVKANMLATLTSTMAMNFTIEHRNPERIAETIMNTLPVCSERQLSYATFSIVDVEYEGKVHILEYDNPHCILIRDNQHLPLNWQEIVMGSEKHKGKKLRYCSFFPKMEDRIIFMSDGITQSGLGSDRYPFGWGQENVQNYVVNTLQSTPRISADKLAEKIVNKAVQNDGYRSKDDTSCASVYFREPRKLLIVTGPPMDETKDKELAENVKNYPGKKVLAGGTTTDIISRELDIEVEDGFEFTDNELPPVSFMEGIDLVTEGILTLNKVNRLLREVNRSADLGKGPADEMMKLILDSDQIDFIVGTRINEAHQDPNVPVDLDIRRTAVNRIASILEEKYLKQVSIKYV
ncbi:MAG: SpoIIE family protein phosphatase [Bacteroidota bacterium]